MSSTVDNAQELSRLFQRSFPELANIEGNVSSLVPEEIEKLLPHEMVFLFGRLSKIPEFCELLDLESSVFSKGDTEICMPGCFMNRTYNGLGALINYLATGLSFVTTSYLSCFVSSGYHCYQTLTSYESNAFKLIKILLNAVSFLIGGTVSWYISLYALPELDLLRRVLVAAGSGSISTFIVSLGNCLFRCATPSESFLKIFNAIIQILNINGSFDGFENFRTIKQASIRFILSQAMGMGEHFVLETLDSSQSADRSSRESFSSNSDGDSVFINMDHNFFLPPSPPPPYRSTPSSPPSYASYLSCSSLTLSFESDDEEGLAEPSQVYNQPTVGRINH